MRSRTVLIGLTLCLALGASVANATLITFNFRENLSDNQHAVTYTKGGVQLNVSAFKDAASANLNRSLAGLGVTGNPGFGNVGFGPTGPLATPGPIVSESLLMEFLGVRLTLVSVLIDSFAAADTFDIQADGSLLASLVRGDTTGTGQDNRLWTAPDAVAATAGNSFRLAATNGGVRIAEMTFAVPEPTTLAIMVLGLAGLAYRMRQAARQAVIT